MIAFFSKEVMHGSEKSIILSKIRGGSEKGGCEKMDLKMRRIQRVRGIPGRGHSGAKA